MTYYSGRVHSVTFDNASQAFYILKVVLDGTGEMVTVRGSIPGMVVTTGSWFGFEGKWDTHAKYGKQIVITKAPVIRQSWDAESVANVLSANGVGGQTLRKIREFFGDADFLKVLGDAEQIEKSGCSSLDALHVVSRWTMVQAYFKAMGFLNDLGLPSGKVRLVWTTFGEDAEKVLALNPWELVRVDGITFAQADEIAYRLGLDKENPNRLRGALIYVSKSHRSMGHLYLTPQQFLLEAQKLIPEAQLDQVARLLIEIHKDGHLVIDRDAKPGVKAVYDPWLWKMEKESAEMLLERLTGADLGEGTEDYIKRLGLVGPKTEGVAKEPGVSLLSVVESAVDEWGGSTKCHLSEAQRQGVINALYAPVSILTGLPGTGKTFCMRAVVSILKDMGIPYLLCAPTGIAAKNLSLSTSAQASTIHRAFSARGSSDNTREATYIGITGDSDKFGSVGAEQDGEWGYGAPSNYYPADVVLVDEISMVDQHLLYRLLSCTRPGCRLIFVGDAAQLPSVGPGNVLRDMIASKRFPMVFLTEIFRQKDTSGIVFAAHAIHQGEVPEVNSRDFRLLTVPKDEAVADTLIDLATKLTSQKVDFQILSPRHAGPVGVTALNARLRELLNPAGRGAQEIHIGESVIREDDRIMVIKNNYELRIFNGDMGRVSRIDRKAKEVVLNIVGDPEQQVRIPSKDIGGQIRLAYACTIHKMQGLECDVILMPVVDSFRHQLQRNLLYTAVTRAKRRVILVGNSGALMKAVLNDSEDQRNTLFRERLLKGGLGVVENG